MQGEIGNIIFVLILEARQLRFIIKINSLATLVSGRIGIQNEQWKHDVRGEKTRRRTTIIRIDGVRPELC